MPPPVYRAGPARIICWAIVLLAVLFPFLAGASPTSVWVAKSTDKIRPGAVPVPLAVPALDAGRNQFASFQIAIKDPAGVTAILATAGALTGPGGVTIPAASVRLYRVALINLTAPSDAAGSAGRAPDPLIPSVDDLTGAARGAFPFDAAPGDARSVWAEILAPVGAAPGLYSGVVSLSWAPAGAIGGQRLAQAVPYTLRVRSYTLPSTPTLRSYYQVDDMMLCSGHYGASDCGDNWGPRRLALLDQYTRFALDHRISLGGSITYPYPRGQTGAAAWAGFDSQLGPVLDGVAPTRLAGVKLTTLAGWHFPDMTSAAGADFSTHLVGKGWLQRSFFYLADEPPYLSAWADIAPASGLLRGFVPGLKGLVTVAPSAAATNGVGNYIDLFATNVVQITDAESALVSDKMRLWIYDSCSSWGCGGGGTNSNWPSAAIDHAGERNAAMGWTAYRFAATGILYWQTASAYGGDAWAVNVSSGGNGDGDYFYPGTPSSIGGAGHVPVASQRLKLVRQGVEDYELLSMVARAGDPVLAAAQAKLVAPLASSFDPGAADRMVAARLVLANRLEALLSPPLADAGVATIDGGTAPAAPPSRNSPIWAVLIALAAAGTAGAAALLLTRPKT